MNVIVDGFHTVTQAIVLTGGMVAESVPVVHPSQHVVSIRCDTLLLVSKDPKEEVFSIRDFQRNNS